ncbi:MAG: hypothetical protein ABL932_23475, partial [Terricaulis sp.]
MRLVHAISASLFFALAACGQAAAPTEADAQTTTAQGGEVTDPERNAIIAALHLRADGQGQVENECGERVTPQYSVADIGSGPGRVIA